MKNTNKHCHYSGLPSPSAYVDDEMDYDGMGNQGRFPQSKDKVIKKYSKIKKHEK